MAINKRYLHQRYGISLNRVNRKLYNAKKSTRQKKKSASYKVANYRAKFSKSARNVSYWIQGKKA